MKKFILFLFLFLPTLFAQENFVPHKWYLKAGIGINYISVPKEQNSILDLDTGLYANLSAGYQFKENLHGEIEGAYRNNKGFSIKKDQFDGSLTGSIYTYCGLINLILDFPFEEYFIFSIGAGTGPQKTEGKLSYHIYNKFGQVESTKSIQIRNEGIAVQGIIRLLIRFAPRFGVCGEYKYWKAPDFNQNSTLAANLKLDF
jgi:opacity protein-like surface antigen